MMKTNGRSVGRGQWDILISKFPVSPVFIFLLSDDSYVADSFSLSLSFAFAESINTLSVFLRMDLAEAILSPVSGSHALVSDSCPNERAISTRTFARSTRSFLRIGDVHRAAFYTHLQFVSTLSKNTLI